MAYSETDKERDRPRVTLQPPQFRLRTLFVAVAVVCGLLTAMVAIGMAWALGLLMLVLLIGAHVVGNAVGTQLRDGPEDASSPRLSAGSDPFLSDSTSPTTSAAEWKSIKTSRMQEKLPISWMFLLLAAAGAIAGGILGGLFIFSLYAKQLNWISASTGIIASGTIGGMAAFVTGTFIDMARRVWGDAISEKRPSSDKGS